MKTASPAIVVPRPSPKSAPAPRLVSLPSADLVEVPRRAKPPSVPPPLPSKRRSERVPKAAAWGGNADVEALGRTLHDLDEEPDALSGVRLCLDALEREIPCRVAVAHAYDDARSDFIVVDARGENAESMLLARSSHDDPLLRIAMQLGEPFAWDDLRRAPVARLRRFSELGHVTSVLACPIVQGGRRLGAIELVDPLRGGAFRSRDVVALRSMASRLARLIARRGVVTDVATIARFAARTWLR